VALAAADKQRKTDAQEATGNNATNKATVTAKREVVPNIPEKAVKG
jgi:hypothetical protein